MAIISKKVAAKLLCIDKVNAFRMFLSEWEINFIIGTMTRIVDRKHSFLSDKQIAIIDKLYHKMEAEDSSLEWAYCSNCEQWGHLIGECHYFKNDADAQVKKLIGRRIK